VKVYLAPGWRGDLQALAPWVDGLRSRGFDARGIVLPMGRAESSLGPFLEVAAADVVVGGSSFGGRVASLAAAEREVAGLLCFSFPLAGQADERTRHWPRIACPALVVNGDRDELADTGELTRRLPLLRRGRLELVAGGGHDLKPHLDQVLDLAGVFLASLY
jgi:predicted alpha/beta-hydrolase family hydrolase